MARSTTGSRPFAEYRRPPITYFCPDSGIGRAMRRCGSAAAHRHLGLGCGTLAAYGRSGDTLRIYEINPLVLEVAHSQFTYLRYAGQVEVALGDGRLSLATSPRSSSTCW